MAGLNHVGRNAQLSHGSNAARKAVRDVRRAKSGLASGLEKLESRMLMSAVRPDAAFSTADLGVGDDRSFPTTGSAGFSLGFSSPIDQANVKYGGFFRFARIFRTPRFDPSSTYAIALCGPLCPYDSSRLKSLARRARSTFDSGADGGCGSAVAGA